MISIPSDLPACEPAECTPAPSGGASDLMGFYPNGTLGGSRLVVVGDAHALFIGYTAVFGPTAHQCECVAGPLYPWKESPAGIERYAASFGPNTPTLFLDVDPRQIRLHGGFPDCCGSGWSRDAFQRARRRAPLVCTVNIRRATVHDFLDSTGRVTATARHVAHGDVVDAVSPLIAPLSNYWFIRSHGPPASIGLLPAEALACPQHL